MFDKKMKMLLGVSMIGGFALFSPTQVFGNVCTEKYFSYLQCTTNPFCEWNWGPEMCVGGMDCYSLSTEDCIKHEGCHLGASGWCGLKRLKDKTKAE
jgi:hypothetical protein